MAGVFAHVDRDDIEGKLPYASFSRKIYDLDLDDLGEHKDILVALTNKFKENWGRGLGSESFVEDTFMRTLLRDCIFVGHVNTDLDSIAGAICAAELFGGIAARSEKKLNGEIECALSYVGMPPPPLFDDIPGGSTALPQTGKLLRVCLVDHNEVDQMTKSLKDDPNRMKRIAGLIDHHSIASSFTTPSPLFIDVRPWGSMSSIVFHLFLRCRVPIRKEIARLLLCAILSDTLNLKSGTTTPADRFSVALLSAFGEVDDVSGLAMRLFEAKTAWIVGMGAYEMVRGDQKNFSAAGVRYSLAVLEVTSMDPVLAVAEDIITQLRVFKHECGDRTDPATGDRVHDPAAECHCALLFVVDTVRQCSVALVCGSRERHLARAAFPAAAWRAAAPGVRSPSPYVPAEETLCDLGSLVSRKLDFGPACAEALARGVPDWFTAPAPAPSRVAAALASPHLAPARHDSVRMLWDRDLLNAAVFGPPPAAATDAAAGTAAPLA
jgi:manganese-dependent inorganic pyrophosphatase